VRKVENDTEVSRGHSRLPQRAGSIPGSLTAPKARTVCVSR
jgi:hypothetical protein